MKKEQAEASAHWSRQNEQAAGYWQLKLLLIVFRIFPVFILRIVAFPVGFFYFLFSKRGRTESKRFLEKAAPFIDDPKLAKKCRSPLGPLRHITSFSIALMEKIQSWGGKFSFKDIHYQDDDMADLFRDLGNGKGAVLICSHLGNTELLRSLSYYGEAGLSRRIHVTAIMDMKVTAHFNRMIKELNPQSSMDLIRPDEIGPETIVRLQEIIASGGLVAIAGDRTTVEGQNIKVPFFGEQAPLPSGVFYLACLINSPIYIVFGLRRRDLSLFPEYDIHVHKSAIPPGSSRKERQANSLLLARSFASVLESYCKKHPFQWYNFFHFWSEGE